MRRWRYAAAVVLAAAFADRLGGRAVSLVLGGAVLWPSIVLTAVAQ